MLKNYLKIAWRNLVKNKGYSFINIGGLAIGMTVAMLIGVWIYDELSFDKNNKNYKRIGQVYQFVSFGGSPAAYDVTPIPMAAELRTKYPEFKSVSLSTFTINTIVAYEDKKFTRTGRYVEPDFTKIMSFDMLHGSANGLQDMNSILLSESLATNLFGDENPINKIIKIENKSVVKVRGVYKNFPYNSAFKDLLFVVPWSLYLANNTFIKNSVDNWEYNSFQTYAELNEGQSFDKVSGKIWNVRMAKDPTISYKPQFFLHPMSDWHLHSNWENGVKTGGRIDFVWLFGFVGLFILLLACINFMNLSTARATKRSKEVGVRKAVGSVRSQLIGQFFMESLLVVAIAFITAIALLQLAIPFFNSIADKEIVFIGRNGLAAQPMFWIIGLIFTLFTGLLAGTYPALYLSSFNPVKVLKGAIHAGRLASLPRKILVVVQFSVSIFLVIGTAIVFKQIQHAKNRPVGYNLNGLLSIEMNTPELFKHRDAIKKDLLDNGGAEGYAESSYAVTSYGGLTGELKWKGKDPKANPLFGTMAVSPEFGKTINWQLLGGRDFSSQLSTDSNSLVINETASKLIGFKDIVGQTVELYGKNYTVVGVVKDLLMESPFSAIAPTVFMQNKDALNIITIKMNPAKGVSESLSRIEGVFQKYNPSAPFDYKFVDEVYAVKFKDEMRISKLSGFFATLAILISCLGLFGLASFIAEQRKKEIGVRKVVGASVFNLWKLLSKDFVMLVMIALLIASPLAYYFMHQWIQKYTYQAEISWWIFATAGAGALIITLITVSFQAIKAAVANPVKSLRTE